MKHKTLINLNLKKKSRFNVLKALNLDTFSYENKKKVRKILKVYLRAKFFNFLTF